MATMIDPEAEISNELSADERLLWTGRPRQGLVLHAFDAYLVPFSLLWCGVIVFIAIAPTTTPSSGKDGGADIVSAFFVVPFLLAGLYFVFGRFIVDAKQRERTLYAVTTQRVVIRTGLFGRTTKSLNLRTLSEISLSERRDGSGTITFGPTSFMSGLSGQSAWPGMGRYASPSFDGIPQVKEVYDVIRDAQRVA